MTDYYFYGSCIKLFDLKLNRESIPRLITTLIGVDVLSYLKQYRYPAEISRFKQWLLYVIVVRFLANFNYILYIQKYVDIVGLVAISWNIAKIGCFVLCILRYIGLIEHTPACTKYHQDR